MVRAFIPINTLLAILFVGELYAKEFVVVFGFFIALSQTSSNVDGGICSLLLSSPKQGDDSRIRYYLSLYVDRLFKMKILLFLSFGIVVFYLKNDLWVAFFYGVLFGEVLICYNLISNNSVSECDYSNVIFIIFVASFLQVLSVFLLLFGELINQYWFMLFYILSFSCPILFILILKLRKNPLLIGKEKILARLQVSQITSSLILNKDHLLISLFSFVEFGSIYATQSRFMLVPIQIMSVFISKLWVDIAHSNMCLDTYKKYLKTVLWTSITFSLLFSIACAAFFQNYDKWLLVVLFFYVIANSFSGLTSAYATVARYAIPTSMWLIFSMSIVYVVSCVFYYFKYCYFSVFITILYFILLGFKNIKDIKWH